MHDPPRLIRLVFEWALQKGQMLLNSSIDTVLETIWFAVDLELKTPVNLAEMDFGVCDVRGGRQLRFSPHVYK